MTLREQIGQLFMIGFTGTTVTKDLASFLTASKPGGVIFFRRNLESVQQIVDLTNGLQKLSPAQPLLIAIDQEGGRVSRLPAEFTIFPPCGQLGQCNSSELAYSAAATIAKELRAVGINMNMAPVLDVNSNPDNPVIGDRAFGAAPELVGEMGSATIGGLQDNMVVACGKHFPGHGDTATDSHKELPVVDAGLQRLRDTEFPPFQQAIRYGVASLMTAHVLYRALDPEAPATLSSAVIQRLLREEFRYEGVVFTDDLEMHAIIDHDGIGEAAVRSFVAGCPVDLQGPGPCHDRHASDGACGERWQDHSGEAGPVAGPCGEAQGAVPPSLQAGHDFRCAVGGWVPVAQGAARLMAQGLCAHPQTDVS